MIVYQKKNINIFNKKVNKMNFIKENLVTILLVSLIIIIILLFGLYIYIYIITSKYNNYIVETPQNMLIIDNNSVLEKEENTEETMESITVVEKDTQLEESTLSKIANIFNICNASQNIRLHGYTMNAMSTENRIEVSSSGNGHYFNIEFILYNNILYTEIMYNEDDPRITAIKVILAIILVDCVGQVKGYPDGTLFTALGDEVAMNYTIEKEGVEIKQLVNGDGIVVKVDIDSNFTFLDI